MNEKFAARVGDLHSCPKHIGGPVATGIPSVLIGGQPAARAGDTVMCPGTPDVIALASMTVHIGRTLAARLDDPTVHGGKITGGLRTVLIGDGAFPYSVKQNPDGTIQVGKHIIIEGTPEYQAQVLADLSTIAMTTTPDGKPSPGRQTLDRIDGGRHDVHISDWGGAQPGNRTSYADMAGAQNPQLGSSTTVYYNPNDLRPTTLDPSICRPADVSLHHELGHAATGSEGGLDLSPPMNPNNDYREEETNIFLDNQYRAARDGPYNGHIPTRADHRSS